MAEARVGLVRGWIEAYNAGDVEAMIEIADPEIEWAVAREHPAEAARGALDSGLD